MRCAAGTWRRPSRGCSRICGCSPGTLRGLGVARLGIRRNRARHRRSTYYPKAETALDRSLSAQPADNAHAAAGRAVLAVGRGPLAAALKAADAALAINPYDAQALAARVDALTELGRYDEALRAARQADEVKPGLPTFTRLSYQASCVATSYARACSPLAGKRQGTGGRVLRPFPSRGSSTGGRTGRRRGRALSAALAADPAFPAALAGRRVAEAAGDTDLAVQRWSDVVNRLPLPEYLVAYGDLLHSLGRPDQRSSSSSWCGPQRSSPRRTAWAPTWRSRSSRPTTAPPPPR